MNCILAVTLKLLFLQSWTKLLGKNCWETWAPKYVYVKALGTEFLPLLSQFNVACWSVTILTWAKPCIWHTYWLYQSMYFETDERLINSARKCTSIQSFYSFFIAVKWLDRFTSTGIEMYIILILTIDVFHFHCWLNTKKDPSQRKSGNLEKKCINFNSL